MEKSTKKNIEGVLAQIDISQDTHIKYGGNLERMIKSLIIELEAALQQNQKQLMEKQSLLFIMNVDGLRLKIFCKKILEIESIFLDFSRIKNGSKGLENGSKGLEKNFWINNCETEG
ncbi:unnamed protein product [Paramecium sonneborni]|uniref:Uncharacterized protein n=1 Tax=Paramecium sonneborni TaxID=65129 RepID=A0A8S1RMF6_9CILI|nr:unnamed protein product [Paramecium sonneborni]